MHAGVDGYSRLPVYCHCSNNNWSDTVLELFEAATAVFGLPSRIRCDKGGENFGVGHYMLTNPLRGPGRVSVIAGKSVRNQHVERFWRDLFQGSLSLFYNLFYHLEETGLLDPLDPVHLFCLHYVYLPLINQSLNIFCESYSRHHVRTAGNSTPICLWIAGLWKTLAQGN